MDYGAESVVVEEFQIPDKFVGMVIGRGGEQIKRLQADSGCKIRIAQDNNGSAERVCTLTGSQFCIDEAKRMLDDIVQRGMNREQGGGGGGYQPRQQYGGGNGYNNGGGNGQYNGNGNGGGGGGYQGNGGGYNGGGQRQYQPRYQQQQQQ